MDNAITKQRIIHRLSYDWLKYVGILLLIIIFWVSIFNWIFSVKRNEEIILFTSAYNISTDESDKMLEHLSPKGIRKVSYTVYDKNQQNYLSILQLKGLETADLLILSRSDLDNIDCARHLIPISEEMQNNYIQENQHYNFYKKNQLQYGVMVYQKDNDEYNAKFNFNKLLNFGDGDEDYFLIINGMTPNAGEYSLLPKKQGKNDATLVAFGFLLSEYLE